TQHATEIGGMIDLQGAGGSIIEQNILAEGTAELEESCSVDQGRAAAADISAYGDVAVIGPQQPIIHQVAMDRESAAAGCFQSAGIDHRVCASIDRKRVGAGCDDGAIIYQHHLASAQLASAGDGVVYVCEQHVRTSAENRVGATVRERHRAATLQCDAVLNKL